MTALAWLVPVALFLAMIAGLAAAWLPPLPVNSQQSVNLLENPSFEGDYEIRCSFPGGKPWIAVPCNGPLPSRPWVLIEPPEKRQGAECLP